MEPLSDISARSGRSDTPDMIGLDTNVVVRLLTADEPVQLKAAKRLLAAHEGEHAAFFVNDMVLVELVWVLRRVYAFERAEALTAIQSLLGSDAFAFEDRERLNQAVTLCSEQDRDFADAMIALKNAAAPCACTASFDKTMRGLPGVRLL
jgi:predicted nucleic-acid-binding protein